MSEIIQPFGFTVESAKAILANTGLVVQNVTPMHLFLPGASPGEPHWFSEGTVQIGFVSACIFSASGANSIDVWSHKSQRFVQQDLVQSGGPDMTQVTNVFMIWNRYYIQQGDNSWLSFVGYTAQVR